ncbi:DUF4333 domain-containing protein [Glycomyces sp. L485]|uniref:DUF4333 domain-containing protein n=1 Tax=Glycomyces sp. L485 TaxID=2909235 RepID=UPI001F4B6020|nr:DUF4333 domain-containing protein [Glycomyces sp. L485]
MPIRKLAALPLAVGALALSACSVEAGPTISGEDLAEAAADALEPQIGARADVDCGDDSIIVSQDKEVDCVTTDPATGEELDTTVTFTGVEGDDWNIQVEVAPAEVDEDGVAEEDQTESDDSAEDQGRLELPAEQLADEAANVLEAQNGSRPEIDCGSVNIEIYVDRQHFCTLTDPANGSEYATTITITEVDGSQFKFNVSVASEPN